ncbi:hypothetical protein FGO68_gene3000 [Halteria grandinella]|uniref:Uncharacterized protein n=1 Tax=Halteria grandinella TaxID=5974 RepID=A0A8J8T497_HALGN|nr:hypothetical protein FGO68_gene3000 [Halteria grandinella]
MQGQVGYHTMWPAILPLKSIQTSKKYEATPIKQKFHRMNLSETLFAQPKREGGNKIKMKLMSHQNYQMMIFLFQDIKRPTTKMLAQL